MLTASERLALYLLSLLGQLHVLRDDCDVAALHGLIYANCF